MNCPVCREVNLTMTERQGIEIDYCPQCRGVWLDRGELDKLIERASGAPAPAPAAPRSQAPPPTPQPGYSQPGYSQPPAPHTPLRPVSPPSHNRGGFYGHGRHKKKKKRENFLEELFDFFD